MGNTDPLLPTAGNGDIPPISATKASPRKRKTTEAGAERQLSVPSLDNPDTPTSTADSIPESPAGPPAPPAAAAAEATPHGEEPATHDGDSPSSLPTAAAAAETPPPEAELPTEDLPTDDPVRQSMIRKYGSPLVSDMDDAQLLLSYLTRNGMLEERKVDDDTVQTLVAARQRLRTCEFDCEKEETKLRKCFGHIARAALPVSVASLRDSLPTPPQRHNFFFLEPEPRSAAERSCIRYRNYSIVVLGLLLIAQIYWTICSSLLSQMPRFWEPKTYLDLVPEIKQAAAIFEESPASSKSAPDTKVNTPSLEDLTEAAQELLQFKSNEANYTSHLLAWWLFMGKASWPDPTYAVGPVRFEEDYQKIYVTGLEVLDVMQKWLLPLLYGALGAMVYVVRTLSGQARDRVFRKEAVVSLNLRVFLGMVSGLAIGWFFNQDTQGAATPGAISIASLSPFALAFVTGYAVELFFTALDRIVSAFTGKT